MKNIINCEDIVQVYNIVIKDKHNADVEIYKMIFIKMSTKVDLYRKPFVATNLSYSQYKKIHIVWTRTEKEILYI